MIRFKCPNCAKGFTVDEGDCGKKGKCPGCKSIIVIPHNSEAPSVSEQPVSSTQDKDRFLDLKELQKPKVLDNHQASTVSAEAGFAAETGWQEAKKSKVILKENYPGLLIYFSIRQI
jgi:phage FluMu protein Com